MNRFTLQQSQGLSLLGFCSEKEEEMNDCTGFRNKPESAPVLQPFNKEAKSITVV